MASSTSARSPNANEETAAVKRTAVGLKNAIVVAADPAPSPGSASLKKQAKRNNILSRSKLPVGVSDLRKLVSAAGLGCRSPASIGVVTDVAE
jgi:hypothetical protein